MSVYTLDRPGRAGTVVNREDDFGRIGRSYRETASANTDRETTIQDLLSGQYNDPVRSSLSTRARGGRGTLHESPPKCSAGRSSRPTNCRAPLAAFVEPTRASAATVAPARLTAMKWRAAPKRLAVADRALIEPAFHRRPPVPSGSDWLFELKIDVNRLWCGRPATGVVRIYSRRGADFTTAFLSWSMPPSPPSDIRALGRRGVVYDQHGMPDFNLIHSKEYSREVSLIAFDILELRQDVRPQPRD